jgi:hypothetical protein
MLCALRWTRDMNPEMTISPRDIRQNGDNFSTPPSTSGSDLLGVDVNVADGVYTLMVAARRTSHTVRTPPPSVT